MFKYVLFSLVLFADIVYSTEYQCSIARQEFRNGEFYTKSYTRGLVHDNNKTIGFNAFDNKDRYTSGILSERKSDVIGIEREFR